MKFAAWIEYVADKELVDRHRPAHRQYSSELLEAGKLAASGPLTDGFGALFVYETDALEQAEALLKADPFCQAGVFARWSIRPWTVVRANRQLFPDGVAS